MNRSIIFPGGAGGNHLRWLMYLDESIDSHMTVQDKVKFLLEEVYPKSRTWNNWLQLESRWRFRDHYQNFISLFHEPSHDTPENKTVFLTFDDWGPVLDHYSIIVSAFNSEQQYLFYANTFLNAFHPKILLHVEPTANKLVIKSDMFFEEELDRDFYSKIIEFYGFNDHYEDAKIVHRKWTEARIRASREMLEFYHSEFWASFLSRIENNLQNNKLLTQ